MIQIIFLLFCIGTLLIIFLECFSFIRSFQFLISASLLTYSILYMFSTILKGTESFYVAIATLIAGLLAYHYTTYNNQQQLINSLDSKSGWRKSLFELAEKQDIVPEDVQGLRTTLRFNYKDNAKTYFDVMTKIIILYCEGIEREKKSLQFSPIISMNSNLKFKCKELDGFETQFDPRIIRLFARYLLADHWEKNLLNNRQKAEYELIKPYREITEVEFKKLYDILQTDNKVNLKQLQSELIDMKQSNLYKNIDSSNNYLNKENELFIYTLQKFIEYSNDK